MRGSRQEQDYARLAARALADSGAGAAGTSGIGNRAAAVDAIGSALAARGRARTLRRTAVGLGGAAAVVSGAIWFASSGGFGAIDRGGAAAGVVDGPGLTIASVRGSGGAIETPRGAARVVAGSVVAAGSRLRASADGDLVAALGAGTRVRLGAGAMAHVTDLGALDRFVLEAGTFGAKVEKLVPGRRFVVVTHDAEVEVRGTEFEVAVLSEPVACEPGARTRVAVREGVVVVRHGGSETRVAAGASWPDCGPVEPAPRQAAEPRPAAARGVAPGHPGGAASGARHAVKSDVLPAPEASSSMLAEQNDLFAAALAARRRGDLDEARRWLDRLLARYPHGQLVESARAERERLVDAARAAGPTE